MNPAPIKRGPLSDYRPLMAVLPRTTLIQQIPACVIGPDRTNRTFLYHLIRMASSTRRPDRDVLPPLQAGIPGASLSGLITSYLRGGICWRAVQELNLHVRVKNPLFFR